MIRFQELKEMYNNSPSRIYLRNDYTKSIFITREGGMVNFYFTKDGYSFWCGYEPTFDSAYNNMTVLLNTPREPIPLFHFDIELGEEGKRAIYLDNNRELYFFYVPIDHNYFIVFDKRSIQNNYNINLSVGRNPTLQDCISKFREEFDKPYSMSDFVIP